MPKIKTRVERGNIYFSNEVYPMFGSETCPYRKVRELEEEEILCIFGNMKIANKYIIEHNGVLYYQHDFMCYLVQYK